jgi:outer membrane protein OmpA-like peptidoglycan-associated protein
LFSIAWLEPAYADLESARQRWKTLEEQDASVLAPKRYREADTAMKALEASPSSGDALTTAESRLRALEVAVGRARSVWPDLLEQRDKTRAAGAPARDPRGWTTAENVLIAAAQKLEAGRADAAKAQAREALPLYQKSRTNAMRVDLLGAADSLRAQLETAKARQYVPRSYVRTLDAIRAADELLQSRGTIDAEVRAAGQRARSEGKHAEYLLQMVRTACEDNSPDKIETNILEWEDATRGLMRVAGVEASLEKGLGVALDQLTQEANRLRSERDRLRVDTTRSSGDADTLRVQVAQLRDDVHDRDLQITELRRQLGAFDTVKKIHDSFGRDEGRVLVEDRDLVLRLHGLQFASGAAELPPAASPILEKVVDAVKAVPGARLVVEGHTDSQGKPDKNMQLSQQRAEAVRDWLAVRLGVDARSITATGYGSSRPVASNDTEEGRALNRRIEIVIARPQ